jgi:hypothetical protein
VEDETSKKVKLDTKEEKSPRCTEDDDGVLWYKGRICVPNVKRLQVKIF